MAADYVADVVIASLVLHYLLRAVRD